MLIRIAAWTFGALWCGLWAIGWFLAAFFATVTFQDGSNGQDFDLLLPRETHVLYGILGFISACCAAACARAAVRAVQRRWPRGL